MRRTWASLVLAAATFAWAQSAGSSGAQGAEDPVLRARAQRAAAAGIPEGDLPPVPRGIVEPPPLPPPELHPRDMKGGKAARAARRGGKRAAKAHHGAKGRSAKGRAAKGRAPKGRRAKRSH